MVLESTIGAIVGGLFRLAPEAMKAFDRKNERSHELAMLEAEMRFAAQNAEHEMRKAEVAMTTAELGAMVEAVKEQGATARAAGKFVAAVSALVRPLVTYWFVVMYSIVKLLGIWMAIQAGGDWAEVVVASWTEDDMSMLALILTFWFTGRVWERQKPVRI